MAVDIKRYIRVVADQMNLRDWTIVLAGEPAGPGRAAEIECVWGRSYATLRLGADWDKFSPASQRSAILHELLECHHFAVRFVAHEGMKRGFGQVFDHQIEQAIDSVADAIAPFFPLPPSPP